MWPWRWALRSPRKRQLVADARTGLGAGGCDAFLRGGLPGGPVSREARPLLPGPPQPGLWWPHACARWRPAELTGHPAPRERGPGLADSLLLLVARRLSTRGFALPGPVSPLAWCLVLLPAGITGCPVFAGPAAALAQSELQRSLHCLDPHQGAEGVCGVRAQVRGGSAQPGLSCWGRGEQPARGAAGAAASPIQHHRHPLPSPCAAPGSWRHA